jgi:segregation and condensation protein B
LDTKELQKQIEVLLFSSPEPLSITTLKRTLGIEQTEVVEEALEELKKDYEVYRGIFIEKVKGGYQIFTKPDYDYLLKSLIDEERKYNISRAALEVLAIVSVFQPITKPEIESIRGISSDGVVKHLVDIELLKIVGRLRTPGRPILYSTTPEFFKYFHVADNEELKGLYNKYSEKFELTDREDYLSQYESNTDTDKDKTNNE